MEEQKIEVITKEEAKACRHRLERRWYRRLIELNFILVVAVLAIVFTSISEYKELATEVWTQFEEEFEDAMAEVESVDEEENVPAETQEAKEALTEEDIPMELQLFITGIAMLVFGYLAMYYLYAQTRSKSLQITEKNFPEVYELIETYAMKLGMEKVPQAYVVQENGILNAFAAYIFRKQYIQINAEIFEVAYREHHDMESLGFIIAHEMAHIYYGHATLHYNLPIWFVRTIPVIGAIASRAREYSADRLAQRISGSDGVSAMFIMMVDRHLYKMIDREDYLEQAKRQKGFFIWYANMLDDHPILCKRIVALDQMEGSGKLY